MLNCNAIKSFQPSLCIGVGEDIINLAMAPTSPLPKKASMGHPIEQGPQAANGFGRIFDQPVQFTNGGAAPTIDDFCHLALAWRKFLEVFGQGRASSHNATVSLDNKHYTI